MRYYPQMSSSLLLQGPPALTSILEDMCRLMSLTVSSKPGKDVSLTVQSKRLSGLVEPVIIKGLSNAAEALSGMSKSFNLEATPEAESWCRASTQMLAPLLAGKTLDEYKASVFAGEGQRSTERGGWGG